MINGINGKTRVVAIVADPIGHVRTPQALNAWIAARGIDAVMVPFHVRPRDFAAFMASAPLIENLVGLVVTIPYKESVLPYCTELSDAARRVGAVNVVRFGPADNDNKDNNARVLHGANFDGDGFVGGLLAQGHAVAGRRVYLAGAGGAGKAIAHALAASSVAELSIYNRNTARAEELQNSLRLNHPALTVRLADATPSGCDIAINATSLGLQADDALPFSVDALASGAVVAEAVMKTDLTPLLARAEGRGLAVHFGRHMLAVQLDRMGQFLGLV